jgi:N6-adenosine-specific RNA methylase IME4
MTSPGAIPFHPLADLFPLIEGADFEALCEDIRQHGLRQPIQIWNGAIIDGRNRYRAVCAVDPNFAAARLAASSGLAWFQDVSHIHPRLLPAHVISLNLRRRHLDETQRAMVAAKLADRANLREDHQSYITIPEAAKLLNVSQRSVDTAKAIRREAPAEIVAQAERGDVSLHAARTGLRAAKVALAQRGQDVTPEAVAQAYTLLRDQAEAARLAAKERKKAQRAAREEKLAGRIAAANAQLEAAQKRYGVILADPEWRFETWGEGGRDRAPENHYPTSATEAIAARPVGNLAAEDCVLFLWATPPMLVDALEVMAAWRFQYVTHCVWDKGQIGLGYWFRFRHELLLIGVRGNVPAPAMGEQWPSLIEAPLGEHSEKPERFHELIEAYFPTLPKIELNARRARPGWDVWGAEAPEGV